MLAMAIFLAAASGAAKDREFHEVVARLSDAYHTKPMHSMGLLSFVVRFAHPEGVSGIRIAIFDNIDPNLGSGARDLDGLLQSTLGPEFQPFVRVHSNRDGETTYIYARDTKAGGEMLRVVMEPREAVVMKMRLKPEAMKEWINDPVGRGTAHRNDAWRAGLAD
jgi:hypothetical protein